MGAEAHVALLFSHVLLLFKLVQGKEAYLELEKEAADAKLGIWSQAKRESAAEYKRRTKS